MPLTQGEVITGENGKVTYGATPTEIPIVDFVINKTADPVETTDNSTGNFKTYKPAKKISWDGTINSVIKAGQAAPPFNTIIDATFTADTGITYAGSIILTKKGDTINTTDNNATKIAYSFQGTGDLTELNAVS